MSDDKKPMTQTETGIIVCHVRRAPYDVYIGRERRDEKPALYLSGSPWQNPYPLDKDATPKQRQNCLAMYRAHVLKSPALLERLKAGELLNKRLACWCHFEDCGPEPPAEAYCHGDVLRALQTLFYDPATAGDKVTPAAPASPPHGNIIAVKQRGDFTKFPGSASIARRVIYRETWGETADSRKVSLACAHNPEGTTNLWFVALVAVGTDFYAVQSFGQTRTCANVKLIAEGFCREIGTQLRKIQRITTFVNWEPKDRAGLEDAIRTVWPADVPTDAPTDIPPEYASARRFSQQAETRTAKEKAAAQKREEAAAAGIGPPVVAVTPSLFDF